MSTGTLRGLKYRKRQDHQIIVSQNGNSVTLMLSDREASGMAASGRWWHTGDPADNTPAQLIYFTGVSSNLEHLWRWSGGGDGLFQLEMGVRGTSDSSHRDDHERWFEPLITLRGIRKNFVSGKFFSVTADGPARGTIANPGIGADGQKYLLGYKHDRQTGGAVAWDVVRYEFS